MSDTFDESSEWLFDHGSFESCLASVDKGTMQRFSQSSTLAQQMRIFRVPGVRIKHNHQWKTLIRSKINHQSENTRKYCTVVSTYIGFLGPRPFDRYKRTPLYPEDLRTVKSFIDRYKRITGISGAGISGDCCICSSVFLKSHETFENTLSEANDWIFNYLEWQSVFLLQIGEKGLF